MAVLAPQPASPLAHLFPGFVWISWPFAPGRACLSLHCICRHAVPSAHSSAPAPIILRLSTWSAPAVGGRVLEQVSGPTSLQVLSQVAWHSTAPPGNFSCICSKMLLHTLYPASPYCCWYLWGVNLSCEQDWIWSRLRDGITPDGSRGTSWRG